jgi:putative transposase
MKQPPNSHYRHRFPAELISYFHWLSRTFGLSFRNVHLILAEHCVVVTYDSVRRRACKFGARFADRRGRARPGDKWHLDGVSRTHFGNWRCGAV